VKKQKKKNQNNPHLLISSSEQTNSKNYRARRTESKELSTYGKQLTLNKRLNIKLSMKKNVLSITKLWMSGEKSTKFKNHLVANRKEKKTNRCQKSKRESPRLKRKRREKRKARKRRKKLKRESLHQQRKKKKKHRSMKRKAKVKVDPKENEMISSLY
jgi:hypothetical protein